MTCYTPRLVAQLKKPNDNGKFPLVFNPERYDETKIDTPFHMACGKCVGCRLSYSREWAIRCEHEIRSLPPDSESYFLTLTYADLPENGLLVKEDFRKFMKRIRKDYGKNLKFFGCGEYGDETLRPHFHTLLFNFPIDDLRLLKKSGSHDLFISDYLDSKWGHGHTYVGRASFDTAAYIARYVLKKINKNYPPLRELCKKAEKEGKPLLDSNGKPIEWVDEYVTMSNKNPIGREYLEQYAHDIYDKGFVVYKDGFKAPIPRYYDKVYAEACPEEFAKIKEKRKENVKPKFTDIKDFKRLSDRHRFKMVKQQREFKREL